jgi:hypothetical protein
MNQYTDNLNKAWDVAAIRQQRMDAVAEVKIFLQELTDAAKQTEKLKFNFLSKNSLADLTNAVREADGLTLKQAQTVERLAKADLIAAKAEIELAKARKINMQASKEEADQNVKTARASTEETKQANIAAKTATERAKARLYNAKAAREEQVDTLKVAKAATEEAKQKEILQRMEIALRKEKERLERQLAKEEAALKRNNSEYEKLKRRYNEAAKSALDIGAAVGANAPEFLEAAAGAKALHDQLYAIESAIGRNQRNVGNYSESLQSINQVMRELPNLAQSSAIFLQSIGNNLGYVFEELGRLRADGKSYIEIIKSIGASFISTAGLASIATTAIVYLGQEMVEHEKKTKILTDTSGVMSKVYDNMSNSFTKTAANLSILKSRFYDATTTLKQKNEIVSELNKKYGDTIGRINSINEAEKFFVERSDAYVEALILRAQIDGAYETIAENSKKFLTQQHKDGTELLSIWQKTGAGIMATGDALFGGLGGGLERGKKRYAELVSFMGTGAKIALKQDVTDANHVLEDFIKESEKKWNEIVSKYKFGFDQIQGDKKPFDATNEQINAEKRRLKALAELGRVELEEDINKQEAVFNNEQEALNKRLEAISRWLNDKMALNEAALEEELQENTLYLDKIAAIEKKSAKSRTNEEKALLIQKDALLAEKQAIVAKYAISENKVIAEAGKKNFEVIKQNTDAEVQYRIDALEKITLNNSEIENEELSALVDRLKRGKISYAKYQAELQVIQSNSAKRGLDDTIAYLDELLLTETFTADQRRKIQEELDKARVKSSELANNQIIKGAQMVADQQKQIQAELIGAFTSIVTLGYKNQIKAADERIKQIDREKETKINEINRTTKDETDARVKIAEVEHWAAGERDKAEQKKVQAQRRAAAFEKAISVASIIAKTAEAVMAALKIPIYGTALAAGYAVIGAAQLAKVITTPIPQYGDGTPEGGHPGGDAFVGERYQDETVEMPGRKPFTVSRPTLIRNMPKGTRVTPVNPREGRMGVPSLFTTGAYSRGDEFGPHAQGIVQAIERVVDAVNNKPVANTTTINGDFYNYLHRKL